MPPFFMASQHDHGPQYTYAEGLEDAIQFGIDAQEAGEELERIKQRDGTIVPAAVVDEARPEDAVLHPAFTWDNEEAAERYRRYEAVKLIKRVRVICPEPEEKPVVRMTVAMPTAPIEPAITEHDPLAHDLSKAVGSLVETKRQLTVLKLKATRLWDKRKMIAADVALAELKEAEERMESAHESLVSGRTAAEWAGR